ncbi:MAG: AbrB/MazE/SpoVT family DNA-binding domain-containing protein [Betaproteobacteria bacterium]|nr:AbrB/MazE/SpoVT family DNA-binding domain-containing protein [Betaproteobacteria bacterium]
MATLTLPTAKIFTTGRSQAVRLPKAFRFNTPEVTIERQGDAIILRPKVQSKEEWWDDMEKILASFEGMPEEIERDRSGLSDPVSFD